ncbi:MAG TPA: nuclear transport factor 2 family protein [Gemmatimonadaceae bacterium]|nr:nuclear transport factor 2 family protein [Gemmatimonadaceae bacterium]
MRTTAFIILGLCAALATAGHTRTAGAVQQDEIIALERAALDRWGNGDPSGFLETYAQEITYFDVGTERRLDGHAAMTEYLRPITGKIKIPRYEMIGPKVQRHGDVAVLTYNLRSEGVQPDGKQVTVRWNSTSVYARMGREWKMIHSHWSLTALPCARGVF